MRAGVHRSCELECSDEGEFSEAWRRVKERSGGRKARVGLVSPDRLQLPPSSNPQPLRPGHNLFLGTSTLCHILRLSFVYADPEEEQRTRFKHDLVSRAFYLASVGAMHFYVGCEDQVKSLAAKLGEHGQSKLDAARERAYPGGRGRGRSGRQVHEGTLVMLG